METGKIRKLCNAPFSVKVGICKLFIEGFSVEFPVLINYISWQDVLKIQFTPVVKL